MTPSNPDLVEAARLFEELEERIRRCINDDLGYLTDIIKLAERTLETLDWCRAPEDRGSVWRMREFTQMYLAMSLNHRGVARGTRSAAAASEDPGSMSSREASLALADLDRAEAIAGDLSQLKVTVSRNMQFVLLRNLGLYDRAIAHAQHTIELDPSSPEGYCELASAYSRMSEHGRALQAADEAVRRAGNDHWRCETLRSRAGVYRALGDETSAERDLANSEHLLRLHTAEQTLGQASR